MKRQFDYVVVEDNGGGLSLYIFKAGRENVFGVLNDFEYQEPGHLLACLDELDAGGGVDTWEGVVTGHAARAAWRRVLLNERDGGFARVAYGDKDGREVYTERMGAAARREWGIEEE